MQERIGNLIQRTRIEQGLSIRALATKAGLPHTTIRDIETGHVKSPRLDTLEPILHALGLTINTQCPATAPTEITLPADEAANILSVWSQLSQEQRRQAHAVIQILLAAEPPTQVAG